MNTYDGSKHIKPNKNIYLDYSSTTPCSQKVVEKMLPYFSEKYGNAGSKNHPFGWDAEDAVENARQMIASCIKAEDKNEIIFTSGATESNNIAIKGVAKYLKKNNPDKNHIITNKIEHKCVLNTCKYLESEGFKITYLPMKKDGIIQLSDVENAITDATILVSVSWVHNEIGVIQNIKDIGELCRSRNVLLHTDCAQGIGKIPINVRESCVDLMSISGHKIYGPKGIGALYVRRGVRLEKIISGGGQEKGLRSGTLPVPLCVGLGEAMNITDYEIKLESSRIEKMQKYMLDMIFKNLGSVYLNGDKDQRVPHNINISFTGVEGESLMMYMGKEIAVSSGSACTSGSLEPSYVLSGIGIPMELLHTAIRITLGRQSTMEDIRIATNNIIYAVNKLRSMSPLWEEYISNTATSIKWV